MKENPVTIKGSGDCNCTPTLPHWVMVHCK